MTTENKICCAVAGANRAYKYVPQDDITPLEITECQKLLFFGLGMAMRKLPPMAVDQVWESLSDEAKRHWETEVVRTVVVPQGNGPISPTTGQGR